MFFLALTPLWYWILIVLYVQMDAIYRGIGDKYSHLALTLQQEGKRV
jgi:hypothetical protein